VNRASEPLELVLADPTPAHARAVVRAREPQRGRGDLELAVAEVVANAGQHGSGPVEVVVRGTGAQLLVVVRDRGRGPANRPPVRPPDVDVERGRGRWLAHRLADVRERRTAVGFEVHLRPRG
jgi:anti-sigma regulatory factor (Ser/Thr protein kinase)